MVQPPGLEPIGTISMAKSEDRSTNNMPPGKSAGIVSVIVVREFAAAGISKFEKRGPGGGRPQVRGSPGSRFGGISKTRYTVPKSFFIRELFIRNKLHIDMPIRRRFMTLCKTNGRTFRTIDAFIGDFPSGL